MLNQIAKAHNAKVQQVMLAFVIRDGNTIAIPRSGKKEHTLLNAKAAELILSDEELRMIDREFPAPTRKVYLDMQ